jgi:multiple sugar transport system permease protein
MLINSLNTASEIFGAPSLLPKSWQWQNFEDAFIYQPYALHYFNSIYIAFIVTVGIIFISGLAGYAFAKIHFKGRSIFFLILLSSLIMPIEVTIIPNFFLMKQLSFCDTHYPLILLPIFGSQGTFAVFLMRQYFITIPAELEEAAKIDGLTTFQIFIKIIMPISTPIISTVAILSFLYSWNSFLEPLVFINDIKKFTIPLSLANFTDAYGLPQWHLQLAATTLSVIPILIVYLIFQKRITNAMALSGIKT